MGSAVQQVERKAERYNPSKEQPSGPHPSSPVEYTRDAEAVCIAVDAPRPPLRNRALHS